MASFGQCGLSCSGLRCAALQLHAASGWRIPRPQSKAGEWTAAKQLRSRLWAVLIRWRAALKAGVDFIATDQYEDLAAVTKVN